MDALLFAGPLPALLGFLRVPDLARWRELAQYALGGLLAGNPHTTHVTAGPADVAPWAEAVLRGDTLPPPTGQGLKLIRTRDASGLPLALAVEVQPGGRWSAHSRSWTTATTRSAATGPSTGAAGSPGCAGETSSSSSTRPAPAAPTACSLHRVRHLVEQLPPGRTKPVLLTTYNTNLAAEPRDRLGQLGGAGLLRRVDVRSIDRLAREVCEQRPGAVLGRPIDDEAALGLWHTVCTEAGEYTFDAEFLDSEWKHVILAQGCGTASQYLRAERKGRGALQRAQRMRIWELAEAYRAKLAEAPRQITYAQIADQAARLEEEHMRRTEAQAAYKQDRGGIDLIHREAGSGMWLRPRYPHIVADEAQDLSASHWRMLRAMVRPGPDDIFLVGDAHQRIYAHQVVLGRLGIRTPGRASRRLTLNYRTTRHILGSAQGLITGVTFDDLDDGTDSLDGYRSVLSGLEPQYYRAPDWETEMRGVAALVKERHERHGTPYSAMAISVPDGAAATQMAYTLARKPFSIPAVELGKDGARDCDGVRIGTMHRFKGLEFQRVFLTGVSEGQVPHQRIEAFRDSDPRGHEQSLRRVRSLLFVAATRARDELVVTWSGRPSRFLPEAAARTARTAAQPAGDGARAAGTAA